jgi:kynureninase
LRTVDKIAAPISPSADTARALDAADPLRAYRERFVLPEGIIYLDGNSLGALPRVVAERIDACVRQAWGRDLITSWNKARWVDLPQRIGARIERLVGGEPRSIVVGDSTSINLFKVLAAALRLRPDRKIIVSERQNFPTDLYIAEGLAALIGKGHRLRLADTSDELASVIDTDTAVVMLTHVNYRTGAMHDMAELTTLCHEAGALAIWDLAHTAGAVPVELSATGADFAVGCGYKYLNGGPGAPAFVYVSPKWQAKVTQPLSGWFGHVRPFAFEPGFVPAQGIDRFLCGTPPVLSMLALEAALEIWEDIDLAAVREKSKRLTDFFIAAVEHLCTGHDLALASPRDPEARGSQVSFSLPEIGYPLMQALIDRGVIGDFRAPDIVRFGFAPLYVGYMDAWQAAEILAEILNTREWDKPEFKRRAAVT